MGSKPQRVRPFLWGGGRGGELTPETTCEGVNLAIGWGLGVGWNGYEMGQGKVLYFMQLFLRYIFFG